MEPFAERLCDAIERKRTPVVVGIDPRWKLLPRPIRDRAVADFGESSSAIAEGYRDFGEAVIRCIGDLVPAVKFQLAFFEAAGPEGLIALADLIYQARSANLIVILDGKRNDIGSTAEAYAQAYLDSDPNQVEPSPWQADALTVNPYLGEEGVQPFLKTASESRSGLFVLVRTSNPGAGKLQDQKLESGLTVYETVADWVEQWSNDYRGDSDFGPAGAVVGATVPKHLTDLRKRMPHSLILVPGYGAQGGKAADISGAFHKTGLGAVVNNSRGLLYAYQNSDFSDDPSGRNWQNALLRATKAMIADLRKNTPAGKL